MIEQTSSGVSDKWDSMRSAFKDVRGLADKWNHPLELVGELKKLIAEKPLVGFGAAVFLGMILHGRIARRSFF